MALDLPEPFFYLNFYEFEKEIWRSLLGLLQKFARGFQNSIGLFNDLHFFRVFFLTAHSLL